MLLGAGGDDELLGEAGDDLLDGGAGNDRLNGGDGLDTFRFSDARFGEDSVRDFQDGLDVLDLAALGVGFKDLSITQDGAASRIVVAGFEDSSISLENTHVSVIDESDFLF
ncbi:MAG: hypothetical protein AAGA53_04600 [Pseudomonadota bacterium]